MVLCNILHRLECDTDCLAFQPTLQLVSLRSDLPSCRITLETYRSCCAVADSCWLLLYHSDTLWRRAGFAGSADILLLEQHTNIPIFLTTECLRSTCHPQKRTLSQRKQKQLALTVKSDHIITSFCTV